MEIEEWRKMEKKAFVRLWDKLTVKKLWYAKKRDQKFMESPLAGATPACKL